MNNNTSPVRPFQGLPDKAISIRQPWAWCIMHAGKDIENRDWSTKFRGDVCIHASKGMTQYEYESTLDFVSALKKRGVLPPGLDRFCGMKTVQRGGIVGVATISDCITESDSPWFFGEYGFVLTNVRHVDFIPVKGALGFFDWRKNL